MNIAQRFLLLGVWLALLSACQSAPAATRLPDFPTPQPPGLSPAHPLPAGQPIQTEHWTVEVRQFFRGEKAWEMLSAVNQYNKPPAPGEEYVLIQFYLQNNSADPEEKSIGLGLTGSRRVQYDSFAADLMTPEPYLRSSLPGGAEMEGWYAYRIAPDETDLLLVVTEWFNFEAPVIYAALTENAAVSVPVSELTAVQPTDVGLSLAEPAPYQTMVTTDDWQVEIMDFVSGEAAWAMVQEANQFNDPPESDMMYLLVKPRVRYIGLDENGRDVTPYLFTLTDDAGNEWERPSVVSPGPELYRHIFPGGAVEGWLVLQVPADNRHFVLVFQPDQETEVRYLSLVGYGR